MVFSSQVIKNSTVIGFLVIVSFFFSKVPLIRWDTSITTVNLKGKTNDFIPLSPYFPPNIAHSQPKQWNCCVDENDINNHTHGDAKKVQDSRHIYACPSNASNFSYFYGDEPLRFDALKWAGQNISIFGGSTSRQFHEQLLWELPGVANTKFDYQQFLFKQGDDTTFYKYVVELDLRSLASIVESLQTDNFVIVNVGSWWDSKTIGSVIDENSIRWQVQGGPGEWKILNNSLAVNNKKNGFSPPDVTFSKLMERCVRLMLESASSEVVIVWRSETHTDCPSGKSFRSSVSFSNMLKHYDIPILNISEASCLYKNNRIDDTYIMGPHVCFPSVSLRHWLLTFQNSFFEALGLSVINTANASRH